VEQSKLQRCAIYTRKSSEEVLEQEFNSLHAHDLMREGIRLLLQLRIAAEDRNGITRHLALARLIPLQLKRRGVETRMVLTGEATPSRVELPLLKAVARARRWALELIVGAGQFG
jgi:hypothetical protein